VEALNAKAAIEADLDLALAYASTTEALATDGASVIDFYFE